MWCDFPNLNWARLRVFADGSADVFDMDGRILEFSSEQEATLDLASDEYSKLTNLDEDDERELGIPLATIEPPVGASDADLLPQMFVRKAE